MADRGRVDRPLMLGPLDDRPGPARALPEREARVLVRGALAGILREGNEGRAGGRGDRRARPPSTPARKPRRRTDRVAVLAMGGFLLVASGAAAAIWVGPRWEARRIGEGPAPTLRQRPWGHSVPAVVLPPSPLTSETSHRRVIRRGAANEPAAAVDPNRPSLPAVAPEPAGRTSAAPAFAPDRVVGTSSAPDSVARTPSTLAPEPAARTPSATGLASAPAARTLAAIPAAPRPRSSGVHPPPRLALSEPRVPTRDGPADELAAANRLRGERLWKDAADAYAAIVARDPRSDAGYVAAVAHAGLLLEHLARPAEAVALYRRALAVSPAGPLSQEALYGIAVGQRALGDRAAERTALQAFLDACTSDLLRAPAEARLRTLGLDRDR